MKFDASSTVIATAVGAVLKPVSIAPTITTFCPVDNVCGTGVVTNAFVLVFLKADPPVALSGPLKLPNVNVVAVTPTIVTAVLNVALVLPEIVTESPTLKPCATAVVTVATLLLPFATAMVVIDGPVASFETLWLVLVSEETVKAVVRPSATLSIAVLPTSNHVVARFAEGASAVVVGRHPPMHV